MDRVLTILELEVIASNGVSSTFSDIVSESASEFQEVAEMALAHTITNKAEAAYRCGDLFEKRRELMKTWENYCVPRSANGVSMLRHN